jgi:hypothetical protein
VYAGQVVGPGVPQIHDYNPGITQSGLFWTVRVPDDSVRVDLKRGTASFALSRFRLDDYYNLANAFAGGPSTPAVSSFVLTFKAYGDVLTKHDEANDFAVRYRLAHSTLEWTAQGGGFAYRSDEAKTSAETFSMLGAERNGAFFP